MGRLGAGFSESASLVAGVDLNDCSVVLNGTESIVLEGEERVFLRRGGMATARPEEGSSSTCSGRTRKPNTKANTD